MTLEQITAKLVAMLGEHTHTAESVIAGMPDSPLSDFDLDSLDLIEIAMQIEDEWGFEFLPEELDVLAPVTLNKLANAVLQKIPPTQGAEHQKDLVPMNDQQNTKPPANMDSMFHAAGNFTTELAAICHAANAKWWFDPETGEDVRTWPPKFLKLWVCTKLLLITTEVGEGTEGYRKDKMDDHLPERKSLEVELADAWIRIGDLAGGMGLDLGGAVRDKLSYNAQRVDHTHAHRLAQGGKSF